VNSPVGPPQPICFTPTASAPRCPGVAEVFSDRNIKKDITPADVDSVLARLRALPISTWTYKTEPASVHHLGPMAQDFHASFGLGADDRTYDTVDGHGVAFAAIQALSRLVDSQQHRITGLERDNRALADRLRALERWTKKGGH
jgi:hypothetical protein